MCIMTDCDAAAICKGYCRKHYDYLRKHGTPYYEPKSKRLGQTKDPLYKTYAGMISRCYVESNSCYKKYGARGVKVCGRWRGPDGFFNFKKDMGERPKGYTLDRVDASGDYCPENCRWTDTKTQNNNRGVSLMYTYKGKTQNLSSWCEELGIPYMRTWERIYNYGYSFEQAISFPKNKQRRK